MKTVNMIGMIIIIFFCAGSAVADGMIFCCATMKTPNSIGVIM